MSEITREQIKAFSRFVHEVGHSGYDCDTMEAVSDALIAAWERQQETCKWTGNYADGWKTACGREVGPCDVLQANYCWNCGKRVEGVESE